MLQATVENHHFFCAESPEKSIGTLVEKG